MESVPVLGESRGREAGSREWMLGKRVSQRGRRNVLNRGERRVHERGFGCFRAKVSMASDRGFLLFVAWLILSVDWTHLAISDIEASSNVGSSTQRNWRFSFASLTPGRAMYSSIWGATISSQRLRKAAHCSWLLYVKVRKTTKPHGWEGYWYWRSWMKFGGGREVEGAGQCIVTTCQRYLLFRIYICSWSESETHNMVQ